jgi:hypothetical protein
VADALAHLESSRKSPPLGVFTHDLFKPSIQLEKDTPARPPMGSTDEGKPVSIPGTPSGEGGSTTIPGASLGAQPGLLRWTQGKRGSQ